MFQRVHIIFISYCQETWG